MTLAISADATVFLVVTGKAAPSAIAPAESTPLFTHGLTFRFPSPHGAIDLAVAAPEDLAAFADLATASILKPVCLPLALTTLSHGVIHARLHNDPQAQRLAQQFLAALTAPRNPAHPRRCLHDCTHACACNNS